MSKLEKQINNATLAWDSKSIKEQTYVTKFSSKSQEYLNLFIDKFSKSELVSFTSDSSISPSFVSEVKDIKANFLDNGPGFVIIDSFVENASSNSIGVKNALLYVSSLLGTPIQQNATGLMVKEVKDRSLSYSDDTTSRYSDNKHGGNYHTDGAEIPPPIPEYLPLLCIRPAKKGGAFKLINSHTIHNKLLDEKPEVLDRLYQDFYWDRRGDLGPNGEEVFTKPIFTYVNNKLTFAYLRRYIEDGYERINKQLTEEDINALDCIDSIIYNSNNIFEETLEPGQLMITVNSRTVHGRDSYTDYIDSNGNIISEKQRLLFRTWVLGEI